MGLLHGVRGIPYRAKAPLWRIGGRVFEPVRRPANTGQIPRRRSSSHRIGLHFPARHDRHHQHGPAGALLAGRADSGRSLHALCQTEPRVPRPQRPAGPECGGAEMNDQSATLVRAITGPIILITIGVLFAFDRFTEFRFSQTWPVLLIVVGLLKLAGGGRRRYYGNYPPQNNPPQNPPQPPNQRPGARP